MLIIRNSGRDRFDFTAPKNACFKPTALKEMPVYLGEGRVPLTMNGLNLSNLNDCS